MQYNIEIAKVFNDIDTAIFFEDMMKEKKSSDLADKVMKFSDSKFMWFAYSPATCRNNTFLSEFRQKKSIAKLVKARLLRTRLESIPRLDKPSRWCGIKTRLFTVTEKAIKMHADPSSISRLYAELSPRPALGHSPHEIAS